jgi:hypothetical protein
MAAELFTTDNVSKQEDCDEESPKDNMSGATGAYNCHALTLGFAGSAQYNSWLEKVAISAEKSDGSNIGKVK